MPRGTLPVIGTAHYPSQLGTTRRGLPAPPRLREPARAGSAEIWSGDTALPCPATPGTRCGVYLQFLNFVTGV